MNHNLNKTDAIDAYINVPNYKVDRNVQEKDKGDERKGTSNAVYDVENMCFRLKYG